MGFPFQTIITGQTFLDRIQGNIANALNSILSPFLGGQLLTGITVNTSATVIKTGLNRIPQIWTICDQNTATTVYRATWDSNSITLIAGTQCVISLWVN